MKPYSWRTCVFLLNLSTFIRLTSGKDITLPLSFKNVEQSEAAFSLTEYDLLRTVQVPFQDAKTQYMEANGHDGFPGFGFKAGSDVKAPHRTILPDSLPSEFAILVSVKPRTRRGGFIFAVLNSFETVVELGVKIAPEGLVNTVVSLFYTDPSKMSSKCIANFTVPKFNGKWARLAFRVGTDNVTLFFNCNESDTVIVKRDPMKLDFESASILYIAQAGPQISEPFEVSQFLLC